MARKTETVVSYLDDLDGTKANETVAFAIDGVAYEIDLSTKNAKAIRAEFGKWAESARKAKRTGSKPRRVASSKPSGEAAAIREWAAASGIEVPARGRIPKAVAEQYAAA